MLFPRFPRWMSDQLVPILLAAMALPAAAATLSVGPGRTYATPCAAFAAAADLDVVEIDAAGNYDGDVCAITRNDLVIRGVNGRPVINAAGRSAEGKAIWVIKGIDTLVDNITFTGAQVPDQNGAGIRQEGRHLRVRNSWFHHNENGILSGADAESDIVIENSEFGFNGFGDGQSHNIYIGHVRSFTLRGSYSHDALVGHLVKSRAANNRIEANRLSNENGGTASYEIDLPNGGYSTVIGNVIQQSPTASNGGLIAYGLEGGTNPGQELYLVSNTLVNDRSAGTFVLVGSGTTRVFAANNVLGGTGTPWSSAIVESLNNHINAQPAFVNRADYDYTPAAGAPFVNAGVDPGPDSRGQPLRPTLEYVHPASQRTRPDDGALDIGALEREGGTPPPDTVPPTVSITSPTDGTIVRPRRPINITIAASDNLGVASVAVSVNGTSVCQLSTAPWVCPWTVPAGRRQSYTIQAVARDAAGNSATAAVGVSTR
jgi:Bacterial Ig domain